MGEPLRRAFGFVGRVSPWESTLPAFSTRKPMRRRNEQRWHRRRDRATSQIGDG